MTQANSSGEENCGTRLNKKEDVPSGFNHSLYVYSVLRLKRLVGLPDTYKNNSFVRNQQL